MKTLGCLLLFLAAPLLAKAALPPAWTPVGKWNAVHTGWKDTLSINADGTFKTQVHKGRGRWFVSWDGKQITLVIAWKRFGAEPLAMVGSDRFFGRYSYGSFELTRMPQDQATDTTFDPAAFKKGFLDVLYASLVEEADKNHTEAAKAIAGEIKKVRDLDPASPDLTACGIWDWDGGNLAVIYPGGMAINGPTRGQWHWTNPQARAFEIDWQTGFIDQVMLSADGNLLNVTNNQGKTFQGHRQPNLRQENETSVIDKAGVTLPLSAPIWKGG
jgi:hypothetical protein